MHGCMGMPFSMDEHGCCPHPRMDVQGCCSSLPSAGLALYLSGLCAVHMVYVRCLPLPPPPQSLSTPSTSPPPPLRIQLDICLSAYCRSPSPSPPPPLRIQHDICLSAYCRSVNLTVSLIRTLIMQGGVVEVRGGEGSGGDGALTLIIFWLRAHTSCPLKRTEHSLLPPLTLPFPTIGGGLQRPRLRPAGGRGGGCGRRNGRAAGGRPSPSPGSPGGRCGRRGGQLLGGPRRSGCAQQRPGESVN